jgi:hypothetical protein
MSEHKSSDPFEAFRSMVQPGTGQEWLKTAASQFWLNQDHLLDCIENLQKGWLARRHEGARAASDATAAMLSAENAAAAAAEYQKWATGARERIMADASELQQLASAAASSMFEPISSPLARATDASKAAAVSNANAA